MTIKAIKKEVKQKKIKDISNTKENTLKILQLIKAKRNEKMKNWTLLLFLLKKILKKSIYILKKQKNKYMMQMNYLKI